MFELELIVVEDTKATGWSLRGHPYILEKDT